MKKHLDPNGEHIIIPTRRVTTLGLNKEQNELVKNSLPTKEYEFFDTTIPTDLIAISAAALIINASALDTDSQKIISEYYTEIGSCTDETVFWIGYPKPSHHLKSKFKCYESFEEFAANLKYHLLSAHHQSKKARDFSKKISDCIVILSLIRSHPGIKTQDLVNKLEIPTRTIQRYISTLQAAGEWIEYDTTKRGWRLQNNISIFFGDHLKDN